MESIKISPHKNPDDAGSTLCYNETIHSTPSNHHKEKKELVVYETA